MVSSPDDRKRGDTEADKQLKTKSLANCYFYLDVKNRQQAFKLETKIKQLHGNLEVFLTKEVTHVITDREEWESSCHDSGRANIGTTEKCRPKSRADAMLERARRNSVVVENKDPLLEARNRGISIVALEAALAWLDRELALAVKKRVKKSFELREPFIKFESLKRTHRPVFKQISNWPVVKLAGSAGDACLVMTRKTRSARYENSSFQRAGFCEICRAEYLKLEEHLDSEKHQAFLKDDANFLALDSLIADGNNFDKFLKMPRTRSLFEDKVDDVDLSLFEEQPIRELRSSSRHANLLKAKELAELESDTWSSGRPKRTCLKGKRISADERLVVDNKTYYKVEVLNSKLRSSDFKTCLDTIKKQPTTPKEDDKGLIVKFKKLRSSELQQLNNEAENFLFPPSKNESSKEDDEDIDNNAPNTTVSTCKDEDTLSLPSEPEHTPKKQQTSGKKRGVKRGPSEERAKSVESNCSQGSRKKKRMSQAEAFILDNQRYYKFETPGSRLRYHGSLVNAIKSNDDKKTEEEKKKIDLEEIKFSFERVPKSEPWYQTFERQDRGDIYYSSYSENGYFWKPLILPYEMGPIPPLDPRICICTYQQVKKQVLEPAAEEESSSSSKTSEDIEPDGKKRNPRKSPRQHASTLAILSSLMHRKRRSPNKNALSVINEDEDDSSVHSYNETAPHDVEEFDLSEVEFSSNAGISFHGEVDAAELLKEYDLKQRQELKKSLRTNLKNMLLASGPSHPGVKKFGRKRKKNKTGWPKSNSRRSKKERTEEEEEEEQEEEEEEEAQSAVNISVAESIKTVARSKCKNRVIPDQASLAKRDIQPLVVMKKLDSKKLSPPKSPRALRKPRGRWYKER